MQFCLLALALPVPLHAQAALMAACHPELSSVPPAAAVRCLTLAQIATIAQPRIGLAAAGANPLAGSASTLGMRLGSTPRVALQLRASGARMSLPPIGGGGSALARSLDLDAGIGLYGGLSPLPTVGGLGSLDLLFSAGVAAGGSGFSGSPATVAAGVRLGALRESFTTPGVSLSGMFRRVGQVSYADADGRSATLTHVTDASLRATVGKRFFALGTLAGLGLDRTSGDVTIDPAPCTGICAQPLLDPSRAALAQTRPSAFAGVTWTSLVFNAAAELGWQRGGSNVEGMPATGYEDHVRKRGIFGSLALRLTI